MVGIDAVRGNRLDLIEAVFDRVILLPLLRTGQVFDMSPRRAERPTANLECRPFFGLLGRFAVTKSAGQEHTSPSSSFSAYVFEGPAQVAIRTPTNDQPRYVDTGYRHPCSNTVLVEALQSTMNSFAPPAVEDL